MRSNRYPHQAARLIAFLEAYLMQHNDVNHARIQRITRIDLLS